MSDSDALRARAKALNLHGLLEHWPEVTGADWVAKLLDWEEQERRRRSLERKRRVMEAQVAALQAEIAGEEDELQMLLKLEEGKTKVAVQERAELAALRQADASSPKKGA